MILLLRPDFFPKMPTSFGADTKLTKSEGVGDREKALAK